jgi:multiple sugar transport system permease protein
MTSADRKSLAKGLAFCSPWIVGFCAFTFLPIVLSFYYSLCDYSLLQKPHFIGAQNYQMLWNDPVFFKSLKNTLIYASLAIPSAMVVSLGLAMLLNVKIPGQHFYRTIIFIPSLVPVVASCMIWLWLLNGRLGLINVLLSRVGIQGPAWLTDVMFTVGDGDNRSVYYWAMPAIAFMGLWSVGHTVTIYLAGLQDVPQELYEAAEIDGAGFWGRLRNVTLPMLSPVIFFNLIMAIIGTIQTFEKPYILTQGGPARATYLFTQCLYENAFRFLKMGYASAMAWIQLLLILALTGIAFWSSRRWVHYQGK